MIPRPRRHAAAQCITLRSRLSQPFIQFEHALLEGRRRVSPSTGRQGRSLGHFVDVAEEVDFDFSCERKCGCETPIDLQLLAKSHLFSRALEKGCKNEMDFHAPQPFPPTKSPASER